MNIFSLAVVLYLEAIIQREYSGRLNNSLQLGSNFCLTGSRRCVEEDDTVSLIFILNFL